MNEATTSVPHQPTRGNRRLLALVGVLVVAMTAREVIRWRNTRIMEEHLNQFTARAELSCYEESRSRFSVGRAKPFPHAVLLLHGYSGSPAEFGPMIDRLESEGIPHYAPRLTGFGLDDFRLLNKVRYSDWALDAEEGYAILSTLAHKVSVIGQSMGGLLAIHLASNHPVEQLVLVAPGLVTQSDDQLAEEVLTGATGLARLLGAH